MKLCASVHNSLKTKDFILLGTFLSRKVPFSIQSDILKEIDCLFKSYRLLLIFYILYNRYEIENIETKEQNYPNLKSFDIFKLSSFGIFQKRRFNKFNGYISIFELGNILYKSLIRLAVTN